MHIIVRGGIFPLQYSWDSVISPSISIYYATYIEHSGIPYLSQNRLKTQLVILSSTSTFFYLISSLPPSVVTTTITLYTLLFSQVEIYHSKLSENPNRLLPLISLYSSVIYTFNGPFYIFLSFCPSFVLPCVAHPNDTINQKGDWHPI